MKTQKTTKQSVGSKMSPEVLQHVKQAQEIHAIIKNDGINPAFLTTPLPSRQEIIDQWKEAHNDEDPTLEEELGEAWKEAKRLFETGTTQHKNRANPDSVIESAMNDPKNSPGVARAMLVEKIRREICVIIQRLELQEDYDDNIRGNGDFSSFVTVSVCNQHSDLCDRLCLIKTTKKPRIIDLACAIATRANGNDKPVLPKTFLDAHKRYGAEARKRLDRHQ